MNSSRSRSYLTTVRDSKTKQCLQESKMTLLYRMIHQSRHRYAYVHDQWEVGRWEDREVVLRYNKKPTARMGFYSYNSIVYLVNDLVVGREVGWVVSFVQAFPSLVSSGILSGPITSLYWQVHGAFHVVEQVAHLPHCACHTPSHCSHVSRIPLPQNGSDFVTGTVISHSTEVHVQRLLYILAPKFIGHSSINIPIVIGNHQKVSFHHPQLDDRIVQ